MRHEVNINVSWNLFVDADGAEEAIEKAKELATEDNTSNVSYNAYAEHRYHRSVPSMEPKED